MEASAETIVGLLRCPRTGQGVVPRSNELTTQNGEFSYPLAGQVPVMICDERSLFRQADYLSGNSPGQPSGRRAFRLAQRFLSAVPSASRNVAAEDNCRHLLRLVEERANGDNQRLLVVGGAILGEGTEVLVRSPIIESVETDISVGPRTQVLCDAHDLPFADATFDAVVCQAVLEHVLDPTKVVSEIHRVLAPGGLVYSEIPFMQQVHAGAYDFTRYTQLGHRRLFRYFDAVDVGAQGGPGMALAWSARNFLRALAGPSRAVRAGLGWLAAWATFWLKYLDPYLARQAAGLDAASGTYFLGRRRDKPVDDREIVAGYRGVGTGY